MNRNLGLGQQQLFFGVVEDREDPLELGRVRVRVVGIHTEDAIQLPTSDLPWATVMTPGNDPAIAGTGWSPNGLQYGSWVVVYFADGHNFQLPLVLGSTVGINPTSILTEDQIKQFTGSTSYSGQNSSVAPPTDTQAASPTTYASGECKLGALTAESESKGKAETITPDAKSSYSYGIYQFNSGPNNSGGPIHEYVKWSTKFGSEFTGKSPGTTEFNTRWKEVAAKDPQGFKDDQNAFWAAKKYAPVASKLNSQLDLANRGCAVKECIFSTSVQYGSLATSIVQNALNGKNTAEMNDAEIIQCIQDYKKQNIDRLMASYLKQYPQNKQGLLNRIENERATLIAASGEQVDPTKTSLTPVETNAAGDPVKEPEVKNEVTISTKTVKVGFRDPHGRWPKKKYLGVADTNFLARGKFIEKTIVPFKKSSIVQGSGFKEPPTPYNAQYPFNKVNESESGHIIEIDDSPNAERIHIYHRAGTFIEFHSDGTIVRKSMKDDIEVVMKDKGVYVFGDALMVVEGNTTLKSFGNIKMLSEQNIDIMAQGNVTIGAAGKLTLESQGTLTEISNKKIVQDAPQITQNSSGSASVNVDIGSKVQGQVKAPEESEPAYDDEPINATVYSSPAEQEKATGKKFESNPNMKEEAKNAPLTEDQKAKVAAAKVAGAGACGKTITETNFTASFQLSPNYTLGDLTTGTIFPHKLREQCGLTELEIVGNLICLATNVLEPLRAIYPNFTITNAFRSAIGTSNSKSQHLLGQAVDLQFADCVGDKKNNAVHRANEITKALSGSFDQLILEYHGNNPVIHISYSSNQKRGEIKSTWDLANFQKGLYDTGRNLTYPA